MKKQKDVTVTAHDIAKAWLLWYGYQDIAYQMAWDAFCRFLNSNPYGTRQAPDFDHYMVSVEAARKIALLCGPHATTLLHIWAAQQNEG